MLMKIWKKENLIAILFGMSIGIITIENNM